MNKWIYTAVVALLSFVMVGSAWANDTYNERYGEIRFNKLPLGGMVSKTPWVGSWWAYRNDGLAFRWEKGTSWSTNADRYADHHEEEAQATLSPAEKFDRHMGRSDKVELDRIEEILTMKDEREDSVNDLIEERRGLIHVLNNLIEENADNSDFKWQDTEEGKKYVELGEKIDEESKEYNEKLDSWEIDTATEFEIKEHGNAQFGVDSWWGHCNAWAAAAIVEDEPRHDFEKDGISWTAADIKGLLTGLWMECQSTFYGSRNDHHEDDASREKVSYKDVTPAAFHIFFADQIGIRDQAFVIDRYTGDEVWNQPVNAYRAKAKPLYDFDEEGNAIPVSTPFTLTKYNYEGQGKVKDSGERDVYPVHVTTTIWWVTDGLPHDALTVENIDNTMSDDDFANHWKVKQAYDDQIHLRTLTYTLWLDKPMEDESARIIGDGEWNHGSASNYAHMHPDFLWQPTGNVNSHWRVYENELIDYNVVLNDLLPHALVAPEPEVEESTEEGSEASSETETEVPEILSLLLEASGLPLSIPDNDPEGISNEIEVTENKVIGSMTVGMDITHTYIGDLHITLEGPAPVDSTVGCVERTTPGCDHCSCQECVCDQNPACCDSTWSAECAALCTGSCGGCDGPTRVVLKRAGDGGSADDISKVFDVKAFDGRGTKGTWRLLVQDNANVDEGQLTHWFVEFWPPGAAPESESASDNE